MNEDLQKKLEKYLAGTLAADEIAEFEQELSVNKELGANLQLEFQAQVALEQAGDQELKEMLSQRGQSQFDPAKLTKTRPLFQTRTWLAIAAAIVLLISLAIFLRPQAPNLPELYAQNYQELSFPSVRSTESLPDSLWSTIRLAYEAEDYASALSLLDRYLAETSDAQAHFFKGLCLLELKRPLEAVEAFEEVPTENMDTQRASWYRALAYLQADKLPESLQALKEIASNSGHYKRKAAEDLLGLLE